MRYTLEENAIDSLQYAMNYFDAFANDDGNNRYLKPTIIFLENAIELFLKLILISQDEECIYLKKSNDIIREAKKYVAEHSEISLAEYLIGSLDVKTITYTESVLEYCRIFWSKNETVKQNFLLLSKYRNAINHFGINANDGINKLVCCIYQCFQLMTNYMYEHLRKASEYFGFADFLDIVEPVIEGGIEYVRQLCVDNPMNEIHFFIEEFKKAFVSKDFNDYLQENGLDITDCEMDYECNDYCIKIGGSDDYALCVDSWYSTFYNATLFKDEGGYLHFAIEHQQNMIYLLKDPVFYPCFDMAEEYYLWRKEFEIGNAQKYSITENNLVRTIIGAIESYSLSASL